MVLHKHKSGPFPSFLSHIDLWHYFFGILTSRYYIHNFVCSSISYAYFPLYQLAFKCIYVHSAGLNSHQFMHFTDQFVFKHFFYECILGQNQVNQLVHFINCSKKDACSAWWPIYAPIYHLLPHVLYYYGVQVWTACWPIMIIVINIDIRAKTTL